MKKIQYILHIMHLQKHEKKNINFMSKFRGVYLCIFACYYGPKVQTYRRLYSPQYLLFKPCFLHWRHSITQLHPSWVQPGRDRQSSFGHLTILMSSLTPLNDLSVNEAKHACTITHLRADPLLARQRTACPGS